MNENEKLINAVDNNDILAVKEAIKNGADINVLKITFIDNIEIKEPLLAIAISNESIEMTKLLLDNKIDVNVKKTTVDHDSYDFEGYYLQEEPMLLLATEKNNYNIFKLLVDNNANINTSKKLFVGNSQKDTSILDIAKKNNNIDIIKFVDKSIKNTRNNKIKNNEMER